MAEIEPLVKKMEICRAVGKFDNDENGKGHLTLAYFAMLVANQKRQPRQIPIYNLVGKPDPEHPEDLDQWPPDGWVEDFFVEGDRLMGKCKVIGEAADMVRQDKVRGASIGTVFAADYDGTPIGSALAHVVLTNKPYIKGMNIAAARSKGGEPVAYHFTALSKEAVMADKDKKPDAGSPGEGDLELTDQLAAKDVLLAQANARIKDLEAANANLLEDVKAAKEAPDLALANKRIRQLERHNLAEKVRRITAAMVRDRQVNMDVVRGWYDHDVDEVVLQGFEGSQFKGEIKLLEYHRSSVAKNPSRSFAPGVTTDEPGELSAADRKAAQEAGKDPKVFEKTRGAVNLTDFMRRKKAATAGKE